MIDAGLSARRLQQRLAHIGLSHDDIHAICLTHEHSDHVGGLATFVKNRTIPIYLNAAAHYILSPRFPIQPSFRLIESGSRFETAGFFIESFTVPHDAVEPLGFIIEEKSTGARCGVLTDLGHVPPLVLQRLTQLDALFIEANYCPRLLEHDLKRPWSTKQRIASTHGHLSNEQAAQLIAHIATDRLRHVFLGHLSSDCNQPQHAIDIVTQWFAHTPFTLPHLVCASQDEPTPVFDITSPLPVQSAYRAQSERTALTQLDLFPQL
jgi:phosphoribosyl 1,2-cyclic phosphodiesterase